MSNYILLKDIPDAKAGTLFVLNRISCGNTSYIYNTRYGYSSEASPNTVENNSEWFKKKGEPDDWFTKIEKKLLKRIVWIDNNDNEHIIECY